MGFGVVSWGIGLGDGVGVGYIEVKAINTFLSVFLFGWGRKGFLVNEDLV